ncbi:MAG: CPBP family intramembrane metalloprotease [Roseburia sp.]|nr:CPBP family intramembrane metalloprotease [Roseburia sp.]
MKTTMGYKIWQIIYPVGIYYVVSSLVYFALELILGNTAETYMLRQMVCSAATVPFILSYYQQDKKLEETVYGKTQFVWNRKQAENILLSVLAASALGIALNNIIAMTPLIEFSSGFKQANASFFGGKLLYELLGSCLIVPIAEELLFRGVVYKRLRLLFGAYPAMLLSALLFGIVHANLVQLLYAGILGLLLAFLIEKTGYLYTAILGHIAANMMAVLRQNTGWLDFSYEADVAGIGFTVVMLLIGVAAVGYLVRTRRHTGSD